MQSITQTQITNMQMNLNLNATMTKALVGMVKEYVTEVTTELSKIYGFPLDDALKRLDLDHLQPNEKKHVKSEKKGPTILLPYCGVTCEAWCKAVKFNSGLMTQCTKTPENQEEYCKMCAKTMDATTGKPKFGSMHDRDKEGWTDPSGKSPLRYVTVMPKIKLDGVPVTEEQVKEEVIKMGWTMPDKEWMKEDADKQRGRPKKSKPMTSSGSVGDDLIANLVLQANLQEEETVSESDQEETPKKVNKNVPEKKEADKKEKEEKKEADKKEKEAKKEADKKEKEAKKEADKKEKEAKKKALEKPLEEGELSEEETKKKEKEAKKKEAKKKSLDKPLEEGELSEEETKKKEKEAKKKEAKKKSLEKPLEEGELSEEETKKKADKKETKKGKMTGEKEKEKALQEATQIAESVAKKKADQLLEKKLEEGELSEEEEEEVSVTKFTFEGKDYLRDDKNVVYDYNSQEEIGVWTGKQIDLYES